MNEENKNNQELKQIFEERFNFIYEYLRNFTDKKQTLSISDLKENLKDDFKFSIYGNPILENSIYSYLGEISQFCIDEKIPNITTIIEFPNFQLKGFYRLCEYRKEKELNY